MPLTKNCGPDAIKQNIKTSIKEGKPHKQAVAIALSMNDKNCGAGKPKRG